MRRQRPGSVERKVQEETVVRFYQLLVDYGKESIDSLEKMDKQLMESQRRAQAELIRQAMRKKTGLSTVQVYKSKILVMEMCSVQIEWT